MPQIQYLMEICELEFADFIQYRPAEVFGKEEFVVVRVQREPKWFQCYQPVIVEFLHVLKYYNANPEALQMLKQESNPVMVLFGSMPLYASLWEPQQEKHIMDLDAYFDHKNQLETHEIDSDQSEQIDVKMSVVLPSV